MRTNRHGILAAVIASLLILGLSTAMASAEPNGPPGRHPMREGGGPVMRHVPGGPEGLIGVIMNALDLTDDQRQQIQTVLEDTRDETQAARQAVEKARQGLEEAVNNDANEAVIRTCAAAVGTALGDEAILRVTTMTRVRAVLTAEQLAKLQEIVAEMRQHRPMSGGGRPHNPTRAHEPPPEHEYPPQ